MTGGPNRSLEELLSDRLHEVDAVEPPDPDFEFRALRAGRERLKRRQSWTRGLVGAAAAVVIGAVAVPTLGRMNVTSGGRARPAAPSPDPRPHRRPPPAVTPATSLPPVASRVPMDRRPPRAATRR